jgi:hypothetical protein
VRGVDINLAEKMALTYVRSLTPSQIGEKSNLNFLSYFRKNLEIQTIAYNYVEKVNQQQYHTDSIASFLISFKSVTKISALVQKYLASLTKKSNYSKSVVDLMVNFTSSPVDPGFQIIYRMADSIDIITKEKGFARNFIDYVIIQNEILPILIRASVNLHNSPNFDSVYVEIQQKYNHDFAERTLIKGKVRWYEYLKDKDTSYWKTYIQSKMEEIERFRLDTIHGYGYMQINNFAWDVFLKSDERDILNKVIGWIEKLVRDHPEDSDMKDTYANLLYKVGQRETAILWQKAACEQDPDSKIKFNTLQKMLSGLPTW